MRKDHAKRARRLGWWYDEGRPGWFKPSETPFHNHGQYADTAKQALELEGINA
jgi:hypothetical protein